MEAIRDVIGWVSILGPPKKGKILSNYTPDRYLVPWIQAAEVGIVFKPVILGPSDLASKVSCLFLQCMRNRNLHLAVLPFCLYAAFSLVQARAITTVLTELF